ncbi:hypothetical protein SLNWT_3197 [Streptomyces albus]|uniref:Uncharacterized protein n=1 Tax=Streptomyces albus (strain ATCC 21838 / DSM 41398 / FERM P-419 / JCM 4703 / NBRC 107858) TaxID=1081613 RepID=A0A0B5EMA0_STRA4|nr:hypothetical protein SLNWT_3197 [Streptomyces albus]AYN33639.1 hypothetical protein DUI70_3138 [Streptomyces albus]
MALLEECHRRHLQSSGEGDEVVDVAAALGAFDAGQHRVRHRTAEGSDASGELALGETAFGAEDFDSTSGSHSGRTYFQGSCCHGSHW